ncbi:MerR family transcriptional regulator [Echinicola jeungdonensis]|uniref:MerR family transcriptional regulator n=1 Tax=Echinicola jeungdonensis TaxID=709343 RepID=A0ABV5J6R3_9BACT|nr:MerR family transcriptional regulator [Echinicola jeungdonensis]MDN3669240.1 MerR family transcriptional regulator [Echinicola jeungdonensis]
MSTYSIKDLEHLSGIKAHTLRIWEQRYDLMHPKRTNTNIRYYDDEDLKLILNVALLNHHGVKISKIAQMSPEERKNQVVEITSNVLAHEDQIYALTVSMIEIDEEGFDRVLTANIDKLGFEDTMTKVVYPFMVKIGILWQIGAINPAQEHFMSNLIRQKLIVAIDEFVYHGGGRKFMLFLPEGELHEISLLYAAYLIKKRGHKVIYLGQSTPSKDLEAVYQYHHPDFLITVITSSIEPKALKEYIFDLGNKFKKSEIILSGFQVLRQKIKLPPNVQLMKEMNEIYAFLESSNHIVGEK